MVPFWLLLALWGDHEKIGVKGANESSHDDEPTLRVHRATMYSSLRLSLSTRHLDLKSQSTYHSSGTTVSAIPINVDPPTQMSAN